MYARYVPSAGGQTAATSSGGQNARRVPGQTNAPATESAEDESSSKKPKRKRADADTINESTGRKSKKSKTADREAGEKTKSAKTKKDKKEKKDKKKKPSEEDEEQTQVKRNVDADGDTSLTGTEAAPVSEKKKPKRDKKKRVEESPAEDDDDQNERHKSVLEQMAKSMKMASEAAANQIAEEPEEEVEQHGLEPLPQPEQPKEEDATLTYDTLPSWLSAPIRVSQSTRTSFIDAGIPAKTAEALQIKGYADAFAVQTAAIPLLLPNNKSLPGDLLISAATGSGKTLAYALPIVDDISQGVVTRLRALVVLPTRELVRQAQEVFELCAKAYEGNDRKRVRIGVSVGSQQLKAEQEMLIERESRYDPDTYNKILQENLKAKGLPATADVDMDDEDRDARLGPWNGEVVEFTSTADVLLCTPGRLVEHMEQTPGFNLDYVRWLVIDEADKLLAQSFQGWLETVMARFRASSLYGARDFPGMPHTGVRKVVLSATLTRDLSLLSQLALHRPQLVVLDAEDGAAAAAETQQVSEHTLPALLREFATRVHDANLKPLYLLELLRGGLMAAQEQSAMASVEEVDANTVTSTTATSQRRRTLRAFTDSSSPVRLVVASDLVARGIDIPKLAHVVNYDLPASLAGYVHRVGRTARAGRPGCAWTLVADGESGWFWGKIAKGAGVRRAQRVERARVEEMSEERVREYETALAKLGKEARERRRR
ncbi:ATP-dependent RNA helicase dbp6 [Beauveria bassiana]|uniref:ATP-dependent RNA helicase n=1 Tax=Beauveria bassiana TaxID=176275 RepID=A0A2N6NZE8_BEABA|nr:ATP-dependent RNA helicase dbp6 [Beauveria bassiana]